MPHPRLPPTPTGALPGALERDGGAVFEGPAPEAEGAPSPQLASCFWFLSVEGTPGPSGAGSAASSAPGAPATPLGSEHDGAAGSVHSFASYDVPEQLGDLAMGPLVGSGSFGRGALLPGGLS